MYKVLREMKKKHNLIFLNIPQMFLMNTYVHQI